MVKNLKIVGSNGSRNSVFRKAGERKEIRNELARNERRRKKGKRERARARVGHNCVATSRLRRSRLGPPVGHSDADKGPNTDRNPRGLRRPGIDVAEPLSGFHVAVRALSASVAPTRSCRVRRGRLDPTFEKKTHIISVI